MMLKRILTLIGGVVIATAAHAQSQNGSYVLQCPKTAPNLSLLRESIRTQVRNSIDTTQFKNTSVGVSLRLVSLDTPPETVSVDTVLGGLSLGEGTPAGLGYTISGMTGFSIQCQWTYKVRIRSSARRVSDNQPVSAVTDNEVKVRRKVFSRWRRPTTTP